MKMEMRGVFRAAFFLLPALAAPAAGAERRVSLTIYSSNLALVRDLRPFQLKAGTGELRFAGVAARIDPASILFRAPGARGVSLLEQSFEYDLAGADAVLSRHLDQDVQVTTKEGRLFSGRLLSAGGDIVLEKKDGGVQTVARDAVQNMDFPRLPGGLVTRPTLVWLLRCEQAAEQAVEASYLTEGLSWHAEYAAVIDADDKRLEVAAWASINNQSGASYENAGLKLVAGDVHRARPEPPLHPMRKLMAAAADPERPFEERALSEYHLYSLDRPATIQDRQIKQIALFPAAATAVRKQFHYDGARNPKAVEVSLEFVNSKAGGLGLPLPAGNFRVYRRDAGGALELVGEDAIAHTPRDEKVRVRLGSAFDLSGERRQKESKALGARARQDSFEIRIRNRKDADVEVVVVERAHGDWEVIRSDPPFEKRDASTIEFRLPVRKGAEAVVEYSAITRW